MTILIKILCFGALLYALLVTINNVVVPPAHQTDWVEIGCCLIAVFVFGALCFLL